MLWVPWLWSHEARMPTYIKSIGKSKALAATLSDTEPEDDSDNEDDGVLNAFTATVNPTERIVEDVEEEEELVDSSVKRWMIKMISIQPMRNFISSLRSIRNYIGWPPRNSVMWNLIVKSFSQSLMKLIKQLVH